MTPKRRLSLVLLLSFLSLLLSHAAFAGWVVEQEMSEGSSPVKVKKVLTFGDGAMRSDVDQMQMAVIMDFSKDTMFMLATPNKTYMDMKISEVAKQMQVMLSQAGSKAKKAPLSVETKETKVISGFKCQKIALMQGGVSVGELWVTSEIKDPGIRGIYEKFIGMVGNEGGPAMGRLDGLKKAMTIGFPIKETYQTEDGQTITLEVKSAKQTSTPASLFAPPAGYSRMTPEMLRQQMGAPNMPGPGPRIPGQ